MEITRGKISRPQKVVLHGKEGVGKSTFASQFPNPVFTDIEDGTTHLDVRRTHRPTSWQGLRGMTREFQQNSHGFLTWVIDTADWAERLCKEHMCAVKGCKNYGDLGYGNDGNFLADEFGSWLNDLTIVCERGMNVLLLAHTHARRMDLPEASGSYNCWEMKLERKAAGVVKEWSDMTLFATYEVFIVEDEKNMKKGRATGGKRILRTTNNPAWEAKNRHSLQPELPFEFASIAHCLPQVQPSAKPESKPASDPTAEALQNQIEGQAPHPATEAATATEAPPAEPDAETPTVADTGRYPAESQAMTQLRDLMEQNDVSVAALMAVVFDKGHFPADTPIQNLPDDYVNRLVTGWPKVLAAARRLANER